MCWLVSFNTSSQTIYAFSNLAVNYYLCWPQIDGCPGHYDSGTRWSEHCSTRSSYWLLSRHFSHRHVRNMEVKDMEDDEYRTLNSGEARHRNCCRHILNDRWLDILFHWNWHYIPLYECFNIFKNSSPLISVVSLAIRNCNLFAEPIVSLLLLY